jgi:hypothetical protein
VRGGTAANRARVKPEDCCLRNRGDHPSNREDDPLNPHGTHYRRRCIRLLLGLPSTPIAARAHPHSGLDDSGFGVGKRLVSEETLYEGE